MQSRPRRQVQTLYEWWNRLNFGNEISNSSEFGQVEPEKIIKDLPSVSVALNFVSLGSNNIVKNTSGIRVGPGNRDQTLAVKSRKDTYTEWAGLVDSESG